MLFKKKNMKNLFYKGQVIKSVTAQDNKFLVLFHNTDFMSVAFGDPCKECGTEGMTLISENANIVGKTIKHTDIYNCVDEEDTEYLYIDLFLYREILGIKIPIFPILETFIYEYKKNVNFPKKDLENSN